MSTLSVVIPTHNRCETLEKALMAYLRQTALQFLDEILVVDDGSTDSTPSVVARVAKDSPIPIRYLQQENKGPAAARNRGIREVANELILFTDDDIIPGPTLIAEHVDWHKKFPKLSEAILGNVTWASDVKSTPFMKWYGSDGPLFCYSRFQDQTQVDCRYFYTCNLSLKTDFLRRNGIFDEDFRVAAYEDIELGYRLNKAGMRLLYNPKALAYHQQHISFEDACRRAKKVTAASEVFKEKEAGRHYCAPLSLRQRLGKRAAKCAAPLLSPLKSLMDARFPLPWTFYRVMLRVFCR